MLCLIPARGGSRRVPRKNIRDFHGHPIISYSINTALESRLFDRIVVSTDCEETAFIAEEYGAEVHHRDTYASRDDVGTQEVAARVLDDLDYTGGCCVLYATAPLITVSELLAGDYLYRNGRGYVMSVLADPLRDAGGFYYGTSMQFRGREPLISRDTKIVPLENHVDINDYDDWDEAVRRYEEATR